MNKVFALTPMDLSEIYYVHRTGADGETRRMVTLSEAQELVRQGAMANLIFKQLQRIDFDAERQLRRMKDKAAMRSL